MGCMKPLPHSRDGVSVVVVLVTGSMVVVDRLVSIVFLFSEQVRVEVSERGRGEEVKRRR